MKDAGANDDAKMTFLEHLEELRKRLIISVLAVLAGMIICWFFRDAILSFLLAPLYDAWRHVDGLDEPHPLNFTSMLEPFVAYLKLSAIGGVFLSAPVILYELWKFIAPGLYAKERRMVVPFVLVSTLLFVGGSTMAYSMVFPIGFRFFLEFAAGQEMSEANATLDIEAPSEGRKTPTAPPASAKTEAHPPDTAASKAAVEIQAVDGGVSPAPAPKDTAVHTDADFDSDSATSVDSAPPPPPKAEEDRPHWLVDLLNHVFTDDCGILNVARTEDREGARLSIDWHRARCGALPEQVRVRRDGEVVPVSWQSVSSDRVDLEKFVAIDYPPPGVRAYVLKVPKNPSAHRLLPMLMVSDYLSFAIRLLLAFGLVFELPILISFLALAGIINYRHLIRFFRYFIVLAFIIGAILTPPDVITQLLLATPLIILYALSIVVAYLFGERPVD